MKQTTVEAQTLTYHGILNPVLWSGMMLKDDVRAALIAVANEFTATWGFDIAVQDVVLTGSNCSYNWNAYSDLDLHIIADMSSVSAAHKDFVSEYLKIKKQLWNEHRKIKIKGYTTEVYAQDSDELLIASGVFSLTHNRWVKKPSRSIPPKPNAMAVKAKVDDFTSQINDAIQQDNVLSMVAILKRLADLRKSGLQTKGEFSTENLAFKTLRNTGAIARLRAAIEDSTDKKLTLESTDHKKDVWYDRKTRLWTGLRKDKDGNQVGDTEHAPDKVTAHKNLDSNPPKLKESSHHGPKAKPYKAKKRKYISKHQGPKPHSDGLSSTDRWKKRRVAKLWAWKRARFARLSREKPASEKAVSHRTYMAARNITYKEILGKRRKSKLPYGERARAERQAKRVYKVQIKNPETRNRYKYRRSDTSRHSGVSYKTP